MFNTVKVIWLSVEVLWLELSFNYVNYKLHIDIKTSFGGEVYGYIRTFYKGK